MTDYDANGVLVPSWGPAYRLVAITPSDSTVLTGVRALWVGGAGNLALVAAGDSGTVTVSAVPAGTLLPIAVTKVMAATTATLIVGLM